MHLWSATGHLGSYVLGAGWMFVGVIKLTRHCVSHSPAGQPEFIHMEALQTGLHLIQGVQKCVGPHEVLPCNWHYVTSATLCGESKSQDQELRSHIGKSKNWGRGRIIGFLQSHTGARGNVGNWEYSGEQTGMIPVFLELAVYLSIYLWSVLQEEMPAYSSKRMDTEWSFTCGTWIVDFINWYLAPEIVNSACSTWVLLTCLIVNRTNY